MKKDKISITGIKTPLGGVTWSKTDQTSEIELHKKHAKAFEAGRLIFGAYLEIQEDPALDYKPRLQRAAAFLKDIGLDDCDLGFFRRNIAYDTLSRNMEKIIQTLWNMGGRLGAHFENAPHLMIRITPERSEEFFAVAAELDLPPKIIQSKDSPLECFVKIKDYYETLIFS